MMNISSLLAAAFEPRRRFFEAATKDPLAAQKKVLLEYLSRNRKTEYGLKYGFSGIRTIEDYQKRVPLSDSETMHPFIDRMAKGEPNILTRDEPVFFGITSGTTSAPKLIPTTDYSEDKKAELLDLWSYYIARAHPEVLKGKILALVSPEIEGHTKSGIAFGAESGHGYKNLSFLVKHLYALPYEVCEIKDYDARYYSILRIAMEQNITTIAMLNPSMILLLCQKIEKWQDVILDDIERGALSTDFNVEGYIRKKIERRLRPNPEKAGELKTILAEKGKLLPKYFWPNLTVIECWKAGTMRLYLKELESYFSDVPVRDLGCLSTEARSSIPISDEGAGGVLAIQTNFYEFIPREEIAKKDKRLLRCDRLETGKEYFMVVTTAGGLYRYNIDDVIRVNGFFNKTPVIEFVQKGLSTTSLAGEKLYASQLNDAVNKALERLQVFIEFFCAIAKPEKMPHYVFLVEFSHNNLTGEQKKLFLRSIEEELYMHDREYEYVRQAQLLGPPVLKVVAKGEFERYRAEKIQNGAHEGQFKLPELTSDSGFDKNFRIDEEIRLG